MIRSTVLTVALLALLAPSAAGSGGPVAGSDAGPAGVTGRDIAARFIAQPVRGGTLVLAVERRGGEIVASRFVRDKLIVPAVALDGSSTGLSGDGSTLVLAAPRDFSAPRAVASRSSTPRGCAAGRASACAATSPSTRSRPTATGCT
jgi:hypothetical protein